MSGIAGCLALAEGAKPDADWASRAARRLAHRGPDDEGLFSDGLVALAARRLAVVDPSAGGHQPMRSADGRYWMVFNGEIYNYAELAKRLRDRGFTPRGGSDTEIILETFAAEGKDFLRRLRGMFAFAIWDTRNHELFCARDPFGIKPLYYTHAENSTQFRFASERKALAGPGEVSVIDPDALRRYLSFQYVPPPLTMTPPARALPPGHFLVARAGGPVDVFRYWRPMLRPEKSPAPGTPERILAVLRESVGVHLRSDVPLGAFLSGGVDSAVLCAIAAETRPGLPTFTAGFDYPGYSEIEAAQETAKTLGLPNTPYVITAAEFAARLPQIIWQLDDPMADAAAVLVWFIAREARRHVGVVLSGEGADELFGGYGVYYQPGVVRAATRLPSAGRSSVAALAARVPPGTRGKGLLERMATPLRDRYIGNANVFGAAEVDVLTRYGGGGVHDVTDPLHDQAIEAGLDDVATMQFIDINTWLPGDVLVKADRMSMAHGLELRVPFLDREVMAVAARLARAEKTAATTTKFALREAIGTILPHETIDQAQRGFAVPIGQWFRGELSGFAEQIIREARTEDWLDKRAVLDVLRRFRASDPEVTWRQLWVLVVFSLWHQIYVERVFDPVAQGWQAARSPQPGRAQLPAGPASASQPPAAPAATQPTSPHPTTPHPDPPHSGPPHSAPPHSGAAEAGHEPPTVIQPSAVQPPQPRFEPAQPSPAQPKFKPRRPEQPRPEQPRPEQAR
ncbi:MAG TPA: asparagine synthase (glutamine-hydrolyzing) [Trebonia sp.]|jgi:asparagine synthase (glutamine-hydrolysing)|nr:asparagine synthase (glutamine-hydrolyzing) [Trebonia sp.]